MRKTLVVVATNNGAQWLEGLFNSIDEFGGRGDADIIIVDTGSTDGGQTTAYMGHMVRMKKVDKVMMIDGGYCTRAYLESYNRYKNAYDNFIFIHDSMKVKDADWVGVFTAPFQFTPLLAIPWLTFGMWYDNDEQKEYIQKRYGADEPLNGFFGPIFSTTREALEELDKKGLLPTPPSNKTEECGWERGWAVAFHQAGIPAMELNHGVTGENLNNDVYTHLTKIRPHRT